MMFNKLFYLDICYIKYKIFLISLSVLFDTLYEMYIGKFSLTRFINLM